MTDPRPLAAVLADYRRSLGARLGAFDELQRQADDLGPAVGGEVSRLLTVVGDSVRRSDERTRVLMEWLQSDGRES